MIKSNKGFTLVELIVVIAILAILAGVAIPVYNGYIQKAQDAAIVTELDAIATAAQAANAVNGGADAIVIKSADKVVSVTAAGGLRDTFATDFDLYYPDATVANDGTITVTIDFSKSKTYAAGAQWSRTGGWVAYVAPQQ